MARADVVMLLVSIQAVCLPSVGHSHYHTSKMRCFEGQAVQRQADGPLGPRSPGGMHSDRGHSDGDAWKGDSTSSTGQPPGKRRKGVSVTLFGCGGLAGPGASVFPGKRAAELWLRS